MAGKKDFGMLFKQINDIMEKNVNGQLRKKDMTFSQSRILTFINKCDGNMATLKDIERHFLISQPTVGGIIKRLESKGFVSVCTDDADRRVKNAFLTEKGAAFCTEMGMEQKEVEQRLINNLSQEETAELHRMLMQVYKNLLQ